MLNLSLQLGQVGSRAILRNALTSRPSSSWTTQKIFLFSNSYHPRMGSSMLSSVCLDPALIQVTPRQESWSSTHTPLYCLRVSPQHKTFFTLFCLSLSSSFFLYYTIVLLLHCLPTVFTKIPTHFSLSSRLGRKTCRKIQTCSLISFLRLWLAP